MDTSRPYGASVVELRWREEEETNKPRKKRSIEKEKTIMETNKKNSNIRKDADEKGEMEAEGGDVEKKMRSEGSNVNN